MHSGKMSTPHISVGGTGSPVQLIPACSNELLWTSWDKDGMTSLVERNVHVKCYTHWYEAGGTSAYEEIDAQCKCHLMTILQHSTFSLKVKNYSSLQSNNISVSICETVFAFSLSPFQEHSVLSAFLWWICREFAARLLFRQSSTLWF